MLFKICLNYLHLCAKSIKEYRSMYHISVCSVEIVVHIKMILVDEIVLFIPVG